MKVDRERVSRSMIMSRNTGLLEPLLQILQPLFPTNGSVYFLRMAWGIRFAPLFGNLVASSLMLTVTDGYAPSSVVASILTATDFFVLDKLS